MIKQFKNNSLILSVAVLMTFMGCNQENKTEEKAMESDVLLKQWTGPYGGIPAFDQMKVEDVKSAMIRGMELNVKEIEAIADNKEAPTFENTIVEMERSGEALDRGFTYYGIFSSNMSSPEFREVQRELAPMFSEFRSKITQNEKLFKRVKALYDSSQVHPHDDDQQRVLELVYKSFEMNGAELDSIKKKRYAAINKELSGLYTKFSNNVLHDEENYITYLSKDQLGGLAEGFVKSAAKIATDKGQEGK